MVFSSIWKCTIAGEEVFFYTNVETNVIDETNVIVKIACIRNDGESRLHSFAYLPHIF